MTIFRQKTLKKRNLITSCHQLKLPHPELIAETALNMLEKHIFKPRKHMLQKHRAAAIYTSCKLHNIEITSSVSFLNIVNLVLLSDG